jgi:hypothetical protein
MSTKKKFSFEYDLPEGTDVEESAGKLEGVGGGFVSAGLPSAKQAGVGLVALKRSQMGVLLCGGAIGKDGRMCVAKVSTCSTASHLKNKCWEQAFGAITDSDSSMLFIRSSAKESDQIVHMEPSLPEEVADERYLKATRTVSSWSSLFKSLKGLPDISKEVHAELLERSSKPLPAMGLMTPRKPKKKVRLATEDDVKVEDDGMVTLKSIDDELGPTDETAMAIMRTGWPSLIENQSILRDELFDQKEDLVRVVEGSEMNEDKIARLEQEVGERMESGTRSLFEEARLAKLDAKVMLDKLTKIETEMDSSLAAVASDTHDSVVEEIGGALQGSLSPVFKFLKAHSSSKLTPGNLLENRLAKMQGQIDELVQAGGSSRRQGLNFLEEKTDMMDLEDEATPRLDQMAEAVTRLEASVKGVKEQLVSEMVVLDGIVFTSREFVESWLVKNDCVNGEFVYFTDPVGLLHLVGETQYTAAETVSWERNLQTTGYSSRDESKLVHSFEVELPELFGKVPASGITRCDRSLPALQTYEDWESKCCTRGGKFILRKNLESAERYHATILRVFKGEAQTVASHMLSKSIDFLNVLSHWMSALFLHDRAKSGTSDKECWALIAHSVRKIFSVFAAARTPGHGPYRSGKEKATSILWGTLQAHRVMQEMLEHGLSGYAPLSHILNLHLQDNTVPKSVFEVLQATVEKQNTRITTLSNSLDKALSKFAKM